MLRFVKLTVAALLGVLGCWGACANCPGAEDLVRPALLRPGDTIMFVAPAGPLDRERVALARKRLEARGYRVTMREDVFTRTDYLAGSDQRRAEELMQAFLDPEVDAIFPGTGGYGVTRMLDLLDFDAIRRHPKMVIGFSDITALHQALNRRGGMVSFHSPAPLWGLGSPENLEPFAEKYFFRAIEASAESGEDYTIEVPADAPPVEGLGHGTARGRLVGGNLTLITALEGTPYEIDTRGAVLLVEDVGEAPYRIDRMLQQLKSAGKLGTLRGAVLGQFTETETVPSIPDQIVGGITQGLGNVADLVLLKEPKKGTPPAPRFTAEMVLHQYFDNLGIPVLMNFPIGHVRRNCTLPIGGGVEIDAESGTLRVLAGE
jgi:muramoyltetrapeptide carboxypeptidase